MHAAGIFSIFNSNAVRSAQFFKSSFSARYAGRLSSVLEVRTREGNQRKFSAEANTGPVSSDILLEGPLKKNKAAILLNGRLSHLGLWLKPYSEKIKKEKGDSGFNEFDFYDINAKINFERGNKDKFFLSFYKGRDHYSDHSFFEKAPDENLLYKDTIQDMWDWGNTIGAFRWNHLWSEKLFSNFSLNYSRYDFFSEHKTLLNNFESDSGALLFRSTRQENFFSLIEDYSIGMDFDYYKSSSNTIRFGLDFTRHKFQPGISNAKVGEFEMASFRNAKNLSAETGAYFESNMFLKDSWQLNSGFYLSTLIAGQKVRASFQPRLSLSYRFGPRFLLSASIDKMSQYLHLLSSSSIGLPSDIWITSTDRVKPGKAWHYSIEANHKFDRSISIQLGAFFKSMDQLVEFEDLTGQEFINASNWENKVVTGSGKAYGLEVHLKKQLGNLSGWVAYSYARSLRQFEKLNKGRQYPYKYDRKNDLKMVLNYSLSKKWAVNLNWVYGSGLAYSLPTGAYDLLLPDGTYLGPIYYTDEKNAYRLPVYHRLDATIGYTKKLAWGTHSLSLGVYNLYNRENPLYYSFNSRASAEEPYFQTLLLPVMPSFKYGIKLN